MLVARKCVHKAKLYLSIKYNIGQGSHLIRVFVWVYKVLSLFIGYYCLIIQIMA